MLKKFKLFISLLMFFLVVTISEPAAAEELTLQLRWHHGFQFAGYYMANEKGFYQTESLNVAFLEGGVGINHFDQVSQGKAEFGVAGSELVIEYLKGRPFKSIAAIFQHSPYALMVRHSSGYTNPQQLMGKRIYMALAPRTAEIQAMFINEGVPIDKIVPVNPLKVKQNFTDQSIDAFSVYITNGPFKAQKKGIHTRLIKPINYGIDFYGDCLFVKTDFIEKNPETVEKFKKASLQGWSYAFAHPEETIDIILKKYNTDNRSREHLIFEYEIMRELILPDYIPIGQQNPHRWERIAETYVKLGMAPEGKTVESLVFDPKAEQLKKVERRQMIIFGIVILSLFSIAVLYLWNMLLKRQVSKKTEHLKNEINDHQVTQNKLKFALDKYKTLFASFPHGITVSDKSGNIIETNPVAENLLGISKEEHEQRTIDGENWKIIRTDGTDMPPDEWASVKALKENRTISNCEMGIYRSKNDVTWLSVTAAPLPIEKHGVVVTYSDISEKHEALEKIKKLVHDQTVILNNVPSLIYFKDTENNIIRISESVANITGLPKNEIEGRHSSEIYPEMAEHYWKDDLEVIASKQPKLGIVEPLKVNNDVTRWLLTDKIPVFGSDGEVNGVIVMANDITERIHIEDQLKESKNRYESIYQNAQVGLSRTRISDGKVLECNQKMADIFGYNSTDEFVTKGIFADRYVDKRVREQVLYELHKTGFIQNKEARFYRKDSKIIWARFDSRIFSDYGYIEDVVIDITQQKESEEKLLRQQKAISLNNKIANVFLTSLGDEVFADTLDVIRGTLESPFGYFGYIDDNGNLNCPSMTRNIWDKCDVPDKSIVFLRDVWGGVWGESLKEAKTVISNSGLKLPEGHIQIKSAMAVPIIHHDELIGQFVVADKEGGYNQYEKFLLESAASQTAPILNNLLEKEAQEKAMITNNGWMQ